jgi:endonuclease/exonuclease/phosphatase family metal-dependent hydrolase
MADPLRLASYNIRKALGTDRRRDPRRILEVVARMRADVVVLQEADHRLGARPAAVPLGDIRERTGLAPVPIATSPVSLGWHGIAILVRGEVGVTTVRRIFLPGLEPRGAIAVDLDTHAGALRLVAVHLGLVRASRRRQLAAIAAAIGAEDPRPTVIAGDFNEWSRRKGLGTLPPDFTVHAPGPSFHARRPMAALDRFAVDDRVEILDMGVVRDATTAVASDHLPIWAELRPQAAGRPISTDRGASPSLPPGFRRVDRPADLRPRTRPDTNNQR